MELGSNCLPMYMGVAGKDGTLTAEAARSRDSVTGTTRHQRGDQPLTRKSLSFDPRRHPFKPTFTKQVFQDGEIYNSYSTTCI